jgi:hypothetical protein
MRGTRDGAPQEWLMGWRRGGPAADGKHIRRGVRGRNREEQGELHEFEAVA